MIAAARAAWLVTPVLAAGLVHVVVLKRDMLGRLAVPLDGGRRLGGRPLLGRGKTWRGVVLMPPLTAVAASLAVALGRRLPPELAPFPGRRVKPWLLGAMLGVGYCAGELPNSFVKRRLGIPPGGSGGRLAWLQYIIDQTDSVLGCLIALRLVYRPRPAELVLAAGLGTGAHVAVDRLMSWIGLRKSLPRTLELEPAHGQQAGHGG
jgi:CDP-diglyceride synthetase